MPNRKKALLQSVELYLMPLQQNEVKKKKKKEGGEGKPPPVKIKSQLLYSDSQEEEYNQPQLRHTLGQAETRHQVQRTEPGSKKNKPPLSLGYTQTEKSAELGPF